MIVQHSVPARAHAQASNVLFNCIGADTQRPRRANDCAQITTNVMQLTSATPVLATAICSQKSIACDLEVNGRRCLTPTSGRSANFPVVQTLPAVVLSRSLAQARFATTTKPRMVVVGPLWPVLSTQVPYLSPVVVSPRRQQLNGPCNAYVHIYYEISVKSCDGLTDGKVHWSGVNEGYKVWRDSSTFGNATSAEKADFKSSLFHHLIGSDLMISDQFGCARAEPYQI